MYICIYVYILKMNYVGFDPRGTLAVGLSRLKPNLLKKKVHGNKRRFDCFDDLK